MNRSEALQSLPEAHALALSLTEQGSADTTIAEELGIPLESLAPFLRLAEARLVAVLQECHSSSPDSEIRE